MLIFEYKCKDCNSVFEQVFDEVDEAECVSCGGNVERNTDVLFKPNKYFCPKDDI